MEEDREREQIHMACPIVNSSALLADARLDSEVANSARDHQRAEAAVGPALPRDQAAEHVGEDDPVQEGGLQDPALRRGTRS